MKPDVLLTHRLHKPCETALDQHFTTHRLHLAEDRHAMLADLKERITAIAGGDVDAALMDQLPNLKMISNFGVGYDSIDTAEAKKRGIHVTNTPDVLNDAMAEITMGLMIALSRRIVAADLYVRQGKWPSGAYPLQNELRGKTVGIIGLGRIGKQIADRCQAMKMRVIYFGRNKQSHQPFTYYDKLEDMARDADWLIAITPGGAGTQHLVDKNVLRALGKQGYLVNMARGSVVDQSALVSALQNGTIAGAALDVFADEPNVPEELFGMDNVVLSPHAGSATHETRLAMGELVVDNLKAFFADDPLLTPVV